MKKVTKRIVSVIKQAVMAAFLPSLAVCAKSIYSAAAELPRGKKQSFTIAFNGKSDHKVTLEESGILELDVNISSNRIKLYVFDSEGNYIKPDEVRIDSGECEAFDKMLLFRRDNDAEIISFTANRSLPRGTYYIRLCRVGEGNGKITLTAEYPDQSSCTAES